MYKVNCSFKGRDIFLDVSSIFFEKNSNYFPIIEGI